MSVERDVGEVLQLARNAGAVLAHRFGSPGVVRPKPDVEKDTPDARVRDLVTEVDFQVEQMVFDYVSDVAPQALLLAEEHGLRWVAGRVDEPVTSAAAADVEDLWVVDPLDGTINFAYGIPGFCVSVARFRASQPVATAIYDPLLDEMFAWSAAAGSTVNGVAIAVRRTPADDQILGLGLTSIENFRQVVRSFRSWRRMGSAALNLAWVACGRMGAYLQLGRLSPWDFCGGVPIVMGAGGTVTLPDFSPWQYRFDGPTGLVAAAPAVHRTLQQLFRDEPVDLQHAQRDAHST